MPRTTWAEFSRLFLRAHHIPRGFTIGLYHPDRKARTNMEPERQAVRRANLPELENDRTVHALLEAAKGLFPEGSKVLKLRWALCDLKGKPVAPQMSLGRVREMEGEPTDEERELAELAEQRAADLQRQAQAAIADLEELEEDPAESVSQAFMGALFERYGAAVVQNALARHLPARRGAR